MPKQRIIFLNFTHSLVLDLHSGRNFLRLLLKRVFEDGLDKVIHHLDVTGNAIFEDL